ncbi:cytochrome P450 [Roridomyces roridus]|uniref:Cytochrome P450 n=1 Tax=Roridomyces roridus TaxID=1738132 RepID=A0AAD7BFA4_9AGAR|nr:cytochrome P450 [Roridomyces roridus]
MPSFSSNSSLAIAASGAALITYLLHRSLSVRVLDAIPGPDSPSWLYGHEWDIYRAQAGELWNQWIARWGTVVKYKNAFFNGYSILVADPLAIKALLIDGPDGFAVHKPPFNRQTNERLLGRGVIWAEEDGHRKQRRLLSPAFSTKSIDAVSPAFYKIAEEVKSAWSSLPQSSSGEILVNVAEFMSRAALDVIGYAGFQYQFNAVSSATAEAVAITDGLSAALGAPPSFRIFLALALAKSFPWFFNHAPLPAIRSQKESKASIDTVAFKLLSDVNSNATEQNKTSILSILLEDQKKGGGLSDREIVDNVATMITAGHETTGITLSLILYELSRDQDLQNRLREELTGDGAISFEGLQNGKAPILDAIIKEVLRFYPANTRIIRRADRDFVVPLSQPLETKEGPQDRFIIPAGTDIVFPLAAINRLESVWGPDAHLFRAERWLEPGGIPDTVNALPAGYDHIFTFVAGPRACLGMRFAVSEMRVIISELVSTFTFRPADDSGVPLDIVSPAQIMIRAQDPRRGIYGVPLRVGFVNQ